MKPVSNVSAPAQARYTVLKPFTCLGKEYKAGQEFRPPAEAGPRQLRLMVEGRLIVYKT